MRRLPTIVVSFRSVIYILIGETLKRARKRTVNSHVDYNLWWSVVLTKTTRILVTRSILLYAKNTYICE